MIEASSLRGRAINPLLYRTKCAGWWRLRHNAGYSHLVCRAAGADAAQLLTLPTRSTVTTHTGHLDQVAPALELGLTRFGQLEVAGLDLARGLVVRHDHPGRVGLRLDQL